MINNPINVSLYRGAEPPCEDKDGRPISGGPLYNVDTVRNLAAQGKVSLWSKGAKEDGQKWSLDTDQVGELICDALKIGKFLGSVWCNEKPRGSWAACDAYKITVKEWIPAMHKYQNTTYYLKFAISKTGQILLTASNHPEGT